MNNKIKQKDLRDFGIIIGIGFPLILGWLIPFISGHSFRLWTLFISLPSLIIGIIKPNKLIIAYKLWIKLGLLLGWVNSRIILSLVFLLVLQPIAFIMKLTGYDPLKKNKKSIINSYKEKRSNPKIDFKKIF